MEHNVRSYVSSVEAFDNFAAISDGALLTAPKIATAYNVPDSTGAGVKVGIISLGGGFSQADLDKSMSDLGLTAPTVTFVLFDGTFKVLFGILFDVRRKTLKTMETFYP